MKRVAPVFCYGPRYDDITTTGGCAVSGSTAARRAVARVRGDRDLALPLDETGKRRVSVLESENAEARVSSQAARPTRGEDGDAPALAP